MIITGILITYRHVSARRSYLTFLAKLRFFAILKLFIKGQILTHVSCVNLN